MKDRSDIEPRKRVLLTGVFGPFGVDDEYGRKENIMELFHNQVTKGQGIASFRFTHRSFGLYFIASNIDAEVTKYQRSRVKSWFGHGDHGKVKNRITKGTDLVALWGELLALIRHSWKEGIALQSHWKRLRGY